MPGATVDSWGRHWWGLVLATTESDDAEPLSWASSIAA